MVINVLTQYPAFGGALQYYHDAAPSVLDTSYSMVEGVQIMEEALRIAHAVRDACLMATLQAYEDAGLSGLCHEGRWECAVDAIRTLDLQALVQTLTAQATRVS
jgi:hypothetical protein